MVERRLFVQGGEDNYDKYKDHCDGILQWRREIGLNSE